MLPPPPSPRELFLLQAELILQFTSYSSATQIAQSFADLQQLLNEFVELNSLVDPITEQDWHLLTNSTMALTLLSTYARADLMAFLQGDTSALTTLQDKVSQSVKLLS